MGLGSIAGPQLASAEAKVRQASKIRELRAALIEAGLIGIDQQARALGLRRSTAWAILSGGHKNSGLSASIAIRMLSAPDLPALARSKILEYVREKISGDYGHGIRRSREYASRVIAHFQEYAPHLGDLSSATDHQRRPTTPPGTPPWPAG